MMSGQRQRWASQAGYPQDSPASASWAATGEQNLRRDLRESLLVLEHARATAKLEPRLLAEAELVDVAAILDLAVLREGQQGAVADRIADEPTQLEGDHRRRA